MLLEAGSVVALVTIAILYENSKIFKFYFKYLVFAILSFLVGTVFIPLMLHRPRDYNNSYLPAWAERQISKLLGLKWIIRGQDNVVQAEGYVLVVNHQSSLDLLVIAEVWRLLERAAVVVKKEVFYLWPFGLGAWLWGTVFIDKTSGKNAMKTLRVAAKAINTDKAKLMIFPEGTRNSGEEFLPFKKGAFHIAIESQAPIIPVVVSKYRFLDEKQFKFETGVNTISILPPIPTKGLTRANTDELIEKTRHIMALEYKSISKL